MSSLRWRSSHRSRAQLQAYCSSAIERGDVGGVQRTERVHHHRELFGPRLLHGRLDAPRLRTVNESGGCHEIEPDADPRAGAAHEVARGVEQHLVGVDVRMVIRNLRGFGMEVVGPRHERAHDEARPGECLVHGWWLMDRADDGLEVVDRQRMGIQTAVPTDHVEGMVRVHHAASARPLCARARERLHRRSRAARPVRGCRARRTARLHGTVPARSGTGRGSARVPAPRTPRGRRDPIASTQRCVTAAGITT